MSGLYLFLILLIFLPLFGLCRMCESNNQFKFFCFPIEACHPLELDLCRFDKCGFYSSSSTSLVKIKKTKVLPTCAFVNSDALEVIYGVNSGIEVLATGAFKNLPKLRSLHLAFNSIRELRNGVFQNITLDLLDASWNKLIYIDKEAFKGVKDLRYLNLSRNSLVTVPSTLPPTLLNLNLSYNSLDRMLLNSNRFFNLTVLDFSHNFINKVAISYDYPLQEIDLTNNNLTTFDFVDITLVDVLRIPLNKFVTVPEHLLYLNVKKLDIYPNPWRCDELRKAWPYFHRNGINVIHKTISKYCVEPNSYLYRDSQINLSLYWEHLITHSRCSDDSDCSSSMVCRGGKCWNPCEDYQLCDSTSRCYADHHTFECVCRENHLRNPLDIYSTCNLVECYGQNHCSFDQFCYNNKCTTFINQSQDSIKYGTDVHNATEEQDVFIDDPFKPQDPWWFEEIPKLDSPKNNTLT